MENRDTVIGVDCTKRIVIRNYGECGKGDDPIFRLSLLEALDLQDKLGRAIRHLVEMGK